MQRAVDAVREEARQAADRAASGGDGADAVVPAPGETMTGGTLLRKIVSTYMRNTLATYHAATLAIESSGRGAAAAQRRRRGACSFVAYLWVEDEQQLGKHYAIFRYADWWVIVLRAC